MPERRWTDADRELEERAAAAVHQAYLDLCDRFGWDVMPENRVPYDQLNERAKEADRVTVRVVLDALAAAGWRPAPRPADPSCQLPGQFGEPICVRTTEQQPCATCPRTLYPTPTRLGLLADVADGHILRGHGGGSYHRRTHRTFTARIAELEQAGWIEEGDPAPGSGARPWRLTDTGQALLNHHRPVSPNPPPQSPPGPPRTQTPTTTNQQT